MKLTKIGIFIANLFCVFTFCSNAHAIPGDLDTTFDSDGKVVTSFGVTDYAQDAAVQPDGKIVVAGYTGDGANPSNLDLSLARYNSDGSLDTGFGTDGKVIVPESGNQGALSVLILPDGKIFLAGRHLNHLAVYRLNANGSFDATFGTGGRVGHVIGIESVATDAVLQPDGKFVLSGYSRFEGESYRFTVFRLNADGSLDTSFNSIGYTPVLFGGTIAYGVALQSDGKIVAAGRDTGGDRGFWGRFGADGILEGGVSALVQSTVLFNDVAIQADGKIVCAGYAKTAGTGITQMAVTRYNTDRTLDIYFGNGGVNTVDWGFNGGTLNLATSVIIQPSGRIIVGGRMRFPFDFGIARFNSHGFLDPGFGNGGKVSTQFGTSNESEEVAGLALQPDGKIIAVGTIITQTTIDYAVARYDGGDTNTLGNRAPFDYDGDGRSDVSVFRPSTGEWFVFYSGNSTFGVRVFGTSGDFAAPADYDGDAKTDIAIYRPSNEQWWYYSSNGSGFYQQFPWPVGGDFARPGDFTGDGRADLIGYQSSNGFWSRRNSATSTISNVSFGVAGDKPVLGDFDGDTKTDPAIFRPSTGEWWYSASSAGGAHRAVRWGISTDIPAPADYDGDHKTDAAVYRPSEGVWYVYNSATNSSTIMNFGLAEDKPVPADYDGDGRADIAVFRPSTGIWYIQRSTAGFTAMQFGVSTDIPTPNAFVP
jgi:uncharacterized delta-60 repeat protein